MADKGPCLRVGDVISLWLFSSLNENAVGLVVFDVDPGGDVIPYDGLYSNSARGGANKGDCNYVILSNGSFYRLRHDYDNWTFKVNVLRRFNEQ